MAQAQSLNISNAVMWPDAGVAKYMHITAIHAKTHWWRRIVGYYYFLYFALVLFLPTWYTGIGTWP